MKSLFTLLIAALIFAVNPITINAQCTPGDESTCPDPENNGEVCPAVLPNGIIETSYNQQFTIIAPPEYDIEGNIIPLHHIKIVDVKNLPPGITWETNASDSVFMVGEYYCVLLSGTCNETGTFPLKIVVDVYIDFFGQPVYAAQITDSTSISMKVTWDPDGIEDYQENSLAINIWPNPFQDEFSFELPDKSNEPVNIEIFSIIGSRLISKNFAARVQSNIYRIDGSQLPQGTYLLKVTSDEKKVTKLIRKSF
ncbi:MAG: T9SS type A sorting domain-containing protein [Bacteroidetes bacterium]|nr:T9SS type A sorting domain-containing protein [Bacteroidota bacterium]